MEANHFYKGGWKTTIKHKSAQITGQPLMNNKLFIIGTMIFEDSSIATQFRVVADGVILDPPFIEGSSILVEARDLVIEQINDGTFYTGSWEVVQEPYLPQQTFSWQVPSNPGEPFTLATFKNETEAIISFGYSTRPVSTDADTTYRIYIDGEPLKAKDGADLLINQGNSIIVRGKLLAIQVAENLFQGTTLYGSLKTVPRMLRRRRDQNLKVEN